jgi:hypothetical protein
MSLNARDVFLQDLYDHYEVLPARPHAPQVGTDVGNRTYCAVRGRDEILKPVWITACKDWASEVLKDPPDHQDTLQLDFAFFNTPAKEQHFIRVIGHRRMRSPIDGAMVDLVDPKETSGDELIALADAMTDYGNNCIKRAEYIRNLGMLRKARGL